MTNTQIPATNKWIITVTVMFGAFMAVMDVSVVNVILNRQATMLAYNDVSRIFGMLFLITIPLVLLLPGRSVGIQESHEMAGH